MPAAEGFVLPRVPASAGVLVFDRAGRLLILEPTYKRRWTIPGGLMEAGGESPWECARREALEETGIELAGGRLACVDFLRPKPGREGGIRFLFDCGVVADRRLEQIVLQQDEIARYLLADLPTAFGLLSGPLRRRVRAATEQPRRLRYLEEGRPVEGVGS